MNADVVAYRAKWVLPVDQAPIEDGFVAIANDRIESVGTGQAIPGSIDRIIDLGDGVIVPGLINAHTHLEFSGLPTPLGTPSMRFTDWVRSVVKFRRSQTSADKVAAIGKGLAESFASGVWVVGEIATLPIAGQDYQVTDPRRLTLAFLEQLGRDSSQFEGRRDERIAWLRSERDLAGVRTALSPHAPYSVHPELLEGICEQATPDDVVVAMHLAETMAERELIERRSGDFVEMLESFGVWDPDSFEPNRTLLGILKTLSTCRRSLVVHGNYLNEGELDFITSHRRRMSIVFCPRTHAYFGHQRYPLEEMLDRNIRVVLGTDSRASNPDLNLHLELQLVAKLFPNLSQKKILEMVTLDAAVALGIEDGYGSISPGKMAALSFIPKIPSRVSPEQWVLDAPQCVPVEGSGPA